MNVEVENLPNCIASLHIELPPDFVTKEWNEVVQSLLHGSNTTDICTPIRLIRIVQAIECETDVKLGGVMERLFELETLRRTWAKSIINSDQL